MGDDTDRTNILDAKRLLVADLKAMLTIKLVISDNLEHSALELFRFSSVALGIIAGLGITQTAIHGNGFLVIGYIALLITYGIHVFCLKHTLQPSIYVIVPGIPNKKKGISFERFSNAYLQNGEEGYLTQLISDLAGTDEEAGAISICETRNNEKARWLERLGLSFVIMIALSLAMGIFAIVF
jgi:hypothetical protein